jgi:hypothetical protein
LEEQGFAGQGCAEIKLDRPAFRGMLLLRLARGGYMKYGQSTASKPCAFKGLELLHGTAFDWHLNGIVPGFGNCS